MGDVSQPRPLPTPSQPRPRPQVRSYPLFDRDQAHPGKGLTIAKISSALRQAEAGYPERQCDLFEDRIRVDAHLRAVLEGRRDAVAQADWIVQAGGDSDADKQAAALLEKALRKVPNIVETFQHQLVANWFGYSYSEIHWERSGPSVNGARLAVPVWFDNVRPRRFLFDDLDRPKLQQPGGDYRGEHLWAGKWWSSYRYGGIKATSGLMSTAVWWSHMKALGWRDWMVLANRFGIPFVYGQYDDEEMGVDEDEKDALAEAVKSLGSDGWAIFSKMAEIHVVETVKTGGSGELHDRLVARADAELSKLVDGTTLGIETPSSYGSYAASRETGGRTYQLRAGDARALANSFAQQIGRWFVEYNSIPAEPPRLKFHVVRDDSPRGRAEVFDVASNKLRLALDEDQVRQELQLKAPTGARIEPPSQQTAPAGGGDDAPEK